MTNKGSIDDLSIRGAREDDLDNVIMLYSQLCQDVSNIERDFHGILEDQRAKCLILEVRGKIVGMLTFFVQSTLSSGREMVIDTMVIDREHQGRHLGSALLEHCMGMAKAQGFDSITVCCSLAKPELHRFYERAGFKHRMRFYSVLLK